MSDNAGAHLTSDEDDDTSKDLMTFCMQLVHHSQRKAIRIFLSGSHVEIPLYWSISQELGVNDDMLDIDKMIYTPACCAVYRSVCLPETFTGRVMRIYTDDVHTGYVRLIKEKDNTELLLSELYTLTDKTRHGPAVLGDSKASILKYKYSLSSTAADISMIQIMTHMSQDEVPAVHSPYWPVEATEWITRRRPNGFPSKSVLNK